MTSSPPDDRPPSTGQAGDALDDTPTSDRLEPLPPGPRRFRPGLVLSDRYRVLRFLAQGGMGEIYEAEDLQLAERVALKTVRAASAHDPTAVERFKREIQLARRVTHRNVCRIFEFGSHTAPDGDHIDFLTMELLPGETLLEKLQREGSLKPEETLSLLEQMVSALEAAHRAGVVHRDFKSANVLLVPTSAGPVRAVVTDFGLAQGVAGEARQPFEGEGVSGTLDYMAPEQIEGQEPTPAVDVYALGVVVHEMLTGKRPFGGSPEDIQRRLRGPAPSPRALLPHLEPAWERLIVGCLERDPAKRFHDATEVARALPSRTADRRTRGLRLAAAAGALALAAFAGYRALAPRPDAPPVTAGATARRTFAVLPFKNLSGQPEMNWLATALSEMLTSELAAGQKLRAIPGEDVARMRVELQVPDTDSLAKDTLARIHGNLGSDLVVSGSYLAAGGRELRLDVRVQEARAGETISTVVETGTRDELLALVSEAGRRVRESLGLGGLTAAQAGELRAAQPSDPEAARLYAAGLARLRAFDALAGRELLQKAVHAEPGFPLSHAALAEALSRLGYEESAREEARVAFEQGQDLQRSDRLLVEARYREIAREWSQAVDIYRALFELFPDALDHGLSLIHALNSAGRSLEAEQVLAGVRRSATLPAADPRIDLVEAEVAQSLGDYRRQREAARRAAAKGQQTGARLLRARARVLEAYAAGRLGLQSESMAAATEARALYAAVGDRGGAAWALNRVGNVLYQQGELVKAERFYREAEAVFEEIGDKASLTALLNNTAEVFFLQGQLERAGDMLERAGTFARHSADPRRAVIVRLNMANVRSERGERAFDDYTRALADCRKLGDRSLEGSVLWHRAEALLHQGDLPAARDAFTEAIGILEKQGNTRYVAAALSGMADVRRDSADAAGAREAHERALALREKLGDRFGIAESRLALAQLALDEARPQPVEATLREVAAVFAAERAGDPEAETAALLAHTLRAQRRLPEALEAVRRAETLARDSQRPRIRFFVNIEAARQRGADAPAEAARQLQAILAEARRIGYRGLALEAELAFAELDLAGASPDRRRERLHALELAARGAGFERIARAAAQQVER